jgi:L,D-transpeptidase catalytic domain
VKRRELITGGLAAGALCALPARAGAQGLTEAFDLTFAQPTTSPAYQRRLGEIARRERDRAGARLWRKDIVGIADYGRPSSLPRLHFVNMESGKIRSFLVAHGKGSDPEHDGWLKHFSKDPGSEATSRGSYLTCEWYNGKYGTSIRLMGLDADNSTALDRAIVMHPAAYVDASMIGKFGKIGRSQGCFAMASCDFNEALWNLSGGRLLYADRIGDA